jgi:hypothetical protein
LRQLIVRHGGQHDLIALEIESMWNGEGLRSDNIIFFENLNLRATTS